MFTNKDLKKLIIPLVIEQFLAMLVGMMDVMMVSQVGESATSGVSLVDAITNLLVQAFAAMATGGSVIAANLIGKKRYGEARGSADQLVVSSTFIGAILMVICLLFRTQMLDWIYKGIAPDVRQNALIYFLITAFSYPFLAMYNSEAALCRAQGDSKVTMKVSIVVNIVNVAGNAILIIGFGMGTAGVAIPTLISRFIGAAALYVVLQNKDRIIYLNLRKYRLDLPMIKRILKIGIPTGIDGSVFQIGKLLVSTLVASLGTSATTAYAIANTMSGLVGIPGNAIGLSMITVVGQCIGAGEIDQAKRYTKKLMIMIHLSLFVTSMAISLNLPWILKLYHLSAETTRTTMILVLIHNISSFICWPEAFALQNSMRAGGDVNYIMIVSLTTMWLFRVACSYLFVLVFNMGVIGVYSAMIVDWVARGVFFVLRFLSGKWVKLYKKKV